MTKTWFIAAALVAAGTSGAFAAGSPLSRNYTASAGHYVAPGVDAKLTPKKICKIKGMWTDTIGGTFKMKSNTAGTYTNPSCADPFQVSVSGETKTGFNVSATYGSGTDCVSSFTEVETFSGCKATTGTLTDANGSFEDDWTKVKKAHVTPPASLSSHLKS